MYSIYQFFPVATYKTILYAQPIFQRMLIMPSGILARDNEYHARGFLCLALRWETVTKPTCYRKVSGSWNSWVSFNKESWWAILVPQSTCVCIDACSRAGLLPGVKLCNFKSGRCWERTCVLSLCSLGILRLNKNTNNSRWMEEEEEHAVEAGVGVWVAGCPEICRAWWCHVVGLGHFITHGFYISGPLLGLMHQSGLDGPQNPAGITSADICWPLAKLEIWPQAFVVVDRLSSSFCNNRNHINDRCC